MVGAVVLAAGESRRMGTQKLLLPFGGVTVIEHVIAQVSASRVGDIVVVLGHEPRRVAPAIADTVARTCVNREYARGMLSSIRAGLQESAHWEAVLIVLGDQPAIDPEVINLLIEDFEGHEGSIVVPAWEGRRGHPLLIDASYKESILTDYEDVGLRGLLHAYPDRVRQVDMASDAVLRDMDFPEDYQRELNAYNERL